MSIHFLMLARGYPQFAHSFFWTCRDRDPDLVHQHLIHNSRYQHGRRTATSAQNVRLVVALAKA